MDSATNSSSSEYFQYFEPSLKNEITINLVNYRNFIHEQWTKFETNDYPWLEFKRYNGYDDILNSISQYYTKYVDLLKYYYNGDTALIDLILEKLRVRDIKDVYFRNPSTLLDNLVCHKTYMLTWRKESIVDYKNKIDDFFKAYEILLLSYGNRKSEMTFAAENL